MTQRGVISTIMHISSEYKNNTNSTYAYTNIAHSICITNPVSKSLLNIYCYLGLDVTYSPFWTAFACVGHLCCSSCRVVDHIRNWNYRETNIFKKCAKNQAKPTITINCRHKHLQLQSSQIQLTLCIYLHIHVYHARFISKEHSALFAVGMIFTAQSRR